jgi:hypothetical protein
MLCDERPERRSGFSLPPVVLLVAPRYVVDASGADAEKIAVMRGVLVDDLARSVRIYAPSENSTTSFPADQKRRQNELVHPPAGPGDRRDRSRTSDPTAGLPSPGRPTISLRAPR